MNIPLSPRLQVCAGLVAPGDRVADIGCDHGYLGIYLLQSGIANHVIAADVVPGPLNAARRNAEKFGFADKMEFYLSDGVQAIDRDFDTLVCAGMGADTMVHILECAPWLQDSRYRLILQCQSKTPSLRKYLSDTGWRIAEESVVRDGRFLYTVMEVWWEPGYPKLTPAQHYFPPALLENPAEELPAYYRWVVDGLKISAPHNAELQPILDTLLSLPQEESLDWLAQQEKEEKTV